MSAVDDVAARIRRLEETRASKIAQLRHLQHELRFNAITGVDERLDNGQSVARLEVKVESGRNMLFKAGFLSGQRTYVRVTVEVVAAAAVNSNDDEQLQSTTVKEHKVTTKRPVGYTPRWSEILLFEGLPAAVGTVRVDVMQDERIGADDVVGTLILPLARLQDQRPMERWHVLKKNDKDLISEILFSCRFQRSPISALELELELLQNQANELHLFIGRHQNLVELPRSSTMSRPKPLQGKEVVPEKTPERTASTRFSAVASFPPNMRKRESEENVSMNVEMHEAPRAKRQRVMDTEKQVNSLSDRIANWLLPAAPLSASTPAAKTEGDSVGMTSTQFFPFKQRQAAPAQRRPRRTGRPLSAAPQQTPSALQAIEKWLFTDKDGNPRELPFGRQAPSY
ncbi:hypothetical protein PC129_g12963 [Phytophthora cactorum]|uniref:C2 domain-containing protein n=1 Tax=Phytophthora cactorum TaxID=29920 RepID=A0A329RRM0_9STRA|nr:hypothetical protein Pcac1_g1448 [Phytophthora cactorum]KAG2808903.1 hypothetical protein PC112_g16740 [Phytophthora cactorum]KAG2810554.1 hypothetical protein PC111_g15599 [Phytophthora cactorum]KAG3006537.1 hypothetical protein PC120_g17316 [Phytophthora cactorum]KAG3150823.1 hypothetical protein C6341_g16759 [Phytophthora cactorum]